MLCFLAVVGLVGGEVIQMILRDLQNIIQSRLAALLLPGALVAGAVSIAMTGAATCALAGDLLPQSRIDASGTGTVPVAAPLKVSYTKATLHAESAPYESAKDLGGLDRSNRFDALAGTSLAKGFDLHLGVHGTYERDGEISSRRVSGGSFMIKANVISASGFNLALAPYLESGIGSKGKAVDTRAVKSRGGLLLITGFNRKNAFEWNLALGNRNRASEEFDGISFGHESVYKTSVKVNVTNRFGFTAAADGRQIKVMKDGADESSVFGTGRGQLGAFVRFGNVETSVCGGASIDRAMGKKLWKPKHEIADLDGGRLFFGAAISLSLGESTSTRDHEPVRDYGSNAVENEVRVQKTKKAGRAGSVESAGTADSTVPVSYDNDFLKDLTGSGSGVNQADDFSAAEASIKKQDAVQAGTYDINAVEREIAQLRTAEKKANEARAKADESRTEKERSRHAKSVAEQAKLMNKMRKEVQADVDALPSNSIEDLSWHGLE